MSIPVAVADLADALDDFGAGYLLSTSADGRVKAVTVEPEVVDGVLVITGPGRGSSANIAANPAVTLLFPPREPRGFTLLVDGIAEVTGEQARVTPETAVLHRPAAHSDGPPAPDGCGHDCQPVGGGTA
ncbi:MAG: pyridoxamine 5-phosphate oxidase family protein [Nocardioides sp.]|nr:pyridoxamine 5-phosphate oxidase family protein [Nocardioides sp.]